MIGLVVLGAFPGSAAAARLVEPLSVRQSAQVSGGGTAELNLTCPETAVALSGATSVEPGTDSIPSQDPRRWRFRVSSQPGEPARRVRAVLRCVRLTLPSGIRGVRLIVGTVRRPDVFVVAGATRRVALTCERGMVPTGWGLERGTAGRSIAVSAAAPTRRGFVFKLTNTGEVGASATPRIRCLGRTQRASSGERHSFSTRLARFRDAGRSASHTCRDAEYSLATGVSLNTGVLLGSATPTGARGGRWTFSSGGQAKTSLVCLSRGTSFR